MNVPLKRQDEEWLESQVATGRFSSVAEAVAAAVAKLKSDDAIDDQWAKPLIDEALAALDRGERSVWEKGDAVKAIKATRAGSA
jgi:antitoxin ParD1/3/4